MRQYLTYGVIKSYKGIFTKRHTGNTQILIIPSSSTFMVLNLLGKIEDGRVASQMLLRTGLEHRDTFIRFYEKEEQFVSIEELLCRVSEKAGGNYSVALPKKGKFIRSNLYITFEPEYSSGNIQIYLIDGKISLALDEDLNNKTELKMAAHAQRAKALGILDKFASRFLR